MNQLGYYGKTPQRGDFVRFNLPRSFITVWDDWLRALMLGAEAQEENWRERYDGAGHWRFVLSADIAGKTPWLGVMSSSADKVGRRFPFCLTCSLSEQASPCLSLIANEHWFETAEAMIERLANGELAFDQLQQELELMDRECIVFSATAGATPATESASSPAMAESGSSVEAESMTISLQKPASLPTVAALAPLLDRTLGYSCGEFSLWQRADDEQLLLAPGLPSGALGSTLLCGDTLEAAPTRLDLSEEAHALSSCLSPHRGANDTLSPAGITMASTGSAIQLDANDELEAPAADDAEMPPESTTDQSLTDTALSNGDAAEPVPDPESESFPEPHPGPRPGPNPESVPEAVPEADLEAEPEPEPGQHADQAATDDAIPSADDWAALDAFGGESGDIEPVVPEVEPLELDEDDSPDAPWEK